MKTYRTSEVAEIIGIHPNTIRLYEKLGLIPIPERLSNGYRLFTECHIAHCQLVRIAFQVEVLQNGLRKKITQMVTTAATKNYTAALILANEYLNQVLLEYKNANEAIEIVKQLITSGIHVHTQALKRKEVSKALDISADTLRNWEMNGLLTVKRKRNGYRVYTDEDIMHLKIIRSLRCANYSLEAIRRLMQQLSQNPDTDIRKALNTPNESEEIISACDRLIESLTEAKQNAYMFINMLEEMKEKY